MTKYTALFLTLIILSMIWGVALLFFPIILIVTPAFIFGLWCGVKKLGSNINVTQD